MEKENVFSASLYTVVLNSGILCMLIAYIVTGKTFDEYVSIDIIKFGGAFLFTLYLFLCAGLKRMTFTEEGAEFCYYLRPFWRVYRYRYEDVKKVYYEGGFSAGSFSMFYFKVMRNHKIGPFQKKLIFFLNTDHKQAREIVMRFMRRDIPFKHPESEFRRYLTGEIDKWGDC